MLTKPLPGVMDDPFHPLSQGCVCHLLMNEGAGSLAYDVSGHGNHGILKNMLPNVQGSGWGGNKFGGGLNFDGVDDYVDCGNNTSLDITDAITIEAWVNSSDFAQTWKTIAGKYHTAYTLRTKSTARAVQFRIVTSDSTYQIDSAVLSNDNWHHVVATYDKNGGVNNLNIYLDGVLGTPQTATGTIDTNVSDFEIGRRSGFSGYDFNGSIDEVRIYDRALNAKDIKQLYHDPFCNLMQVPAWQLYSPAAPTGAVINQFQKSNLGADLYDGVLIS